jgi:hypothetical protein
VSPAVNITLEEVPFAILEAVKARILENRRKLGESSKRRPSTRPKPQFRMFGASDRHWSRPRYATNVDAEEYKGDKRIVYVTTAWELGFNLVSRWNNVVGTELTQKSTILKSLITPIILAEPETSYFDQSTRVYKVWYKYSDEGVFPPSAEIPGDPGSWFGYDPLTTGFTNEQVEAIYQTSYRPQWIQRVAAFLSAYGGRYLGFPEVRRSQIDLVLTGSTEQVFSGSGYERVSTGILDVDVFQGQHVVKIKSYQTVSNKFDLVLGSNQLDGRLAEIGGNKYVIIESNQTDTGECLVRLRKEDSSQGILDYTAAGSRVDIFAYWEESKIYQRPTAVALSGYQQVIPGSELP